MVRARDTLSAIKPDRPAETLLDRTPERVLHVKSDLLV